jgi:hypothetical protein
MMNHAPCRSRPCLHHVRIALRLSGIVLVLAALASAREQWTPEQATSWAADQPWMAGGNYIPRNAINQLEMWQAETFSPATIDEEFGWAEKIGYTTMRVFLHDLLWQQDAPGFITRIEAVLALAEKHHLRLMLVFFDACWDPNPHLGAQRAPKPHVHNSGWMQSPGRAVLADPAKQDALKDYVVGIVSHFKADRRVVLWDLFNEFDNGYRGKDTDQVLRLAAKAKEWALSADPSQPVSFCIWENCAAPAEKLSPAQRFQVENSDVITFHAYTDPARTSESIAALRRYHRPLICSEYMARPTGSTIIDILPLFKKEHISAYQWGFVDGKTQTKFPWDSATKAYGDEPPVWFHDLLHGDGTPYNAAETALIRTLTGAAH